MNKLKFIKPKSKSINAFNFITINNINPTTNTILTNSTNISYKLSKYVNQDQENLYNKLMNDLQRIKNKFIQLNNLNRKNFLENYKNEILFKSLYDIFLQIDYTFLKESCYKNVFASKQISYINLMEDDEDSKLFTVGVFFIPKNYYLPIHDHYNKIVYSKSLIGEVEISSFNKLNNVNELHELNLREERYINNIIIKIMIRFEVSEPIIKYLKKGETSILTPSSLNFHQVVAVEDSAFLYIIIPDYESQDDCHYFIHEKQNGDHYLIKH